MINARKAWPAEYNERLRAMLLAGAMLSDCAREFGFSRTTIRAQRVRMGIAPRAKSVTDEQRAEMRRLRRHKMTIDAIANRMSVSRHIVASECRGITLGRAWVNPEPPVKIHIPDHILADRDHRLSLAPRDLTAAIFGDPLPGRSALDAR